jgi:hypothetical protein
MLKPKPVLKPKPKFSQRQNNYNDPQLEIMIQSTTTRGSVSSAKDWNNYARDCTKDDTPRLQ